jgi:hypothetical protein
VIFLHANSTKCHVVLFFPLMVTYDIILNSGEDFYDPICKLRPVDLTCKLRSILTFDPWF